VEIFVGNSPYTPSDSVVRPVTATAVHILGCKLVPGFSVSLYVIRSTLSHCQTVPSKQRKTRNYEVALDGRSFPRRLDVTSPSMGIERNVLRHPRWSVPEDNRLHR
jgi:hypothetical protein